MPKPNPMRLPPLLLRGAATFVLAAAVLAIGIWHAMPFIVDDAFISMRYAQRLVDGEGLTWTDGERVEGYSNLSWVLLTAALGALGVDWIDAVRGLGVACTLASFAVLAGSSLLPRAVPAQLAIVVLAALGATATWTIAGLEVPLMLLLLSLVMAGLHRALGQQQNEGPRSGLRLAGLALAVAVWTRPDAPLWAAVAAMVATIATVARHGFGIGPIRQRLWWLLLPPLLAVLAQLVFRLAYYGEFLPNTAYAKATTSPAARTSGLAYLASGAYAMRALLLPAALGLLVGWRGKARAVIAFAAIGTAAWWAYVASVGGDTFPKSRLLVPSLAPLTVLAAHGLGTIAALGRKGWLLALFVASIGVVVARYDATHPRDVRQVLTTWEWDGVATGRWLQQAFGDRRPLLAVDAAGAMPFASRLPSLDMLGLCDRTIARTESPPDVKFVPGHNRANAPYVLSRAPDLVLFGIPPGSPDPQWRGGKAMEADPGFRRDYRGLLATTGEVDIGDGSRRELRITAWARLEGRAGVVREGNVVRVPGPWLGSWRQPIACFSETPGVTLAERLQVVHEAAAFWLAGGLLAVLDDQERLVGEVRKPGVHRLSWLPLPAGRHRVVADELPAGVTLALHAPDGDALPQSGAVFEVAGSGDGPALVDVVLDVPADVPLPFSIDEVQIERID